MTPPHSRPDSVDPQDLRAAASSGDALWVLRLLAAGAAPDDDARCGFTPLRDCVLMASVWEPEDAPDTPPALVDDWASPEERKTARRESRARYRAQCDAHRRRVDAGAFCLPDDTRHYETARLLIDAGADVNAVDGEGDPVLAIAASGSARMVGLLLDRGACIDAPGQVGWSPLMNAALACNTPVVRLLLDRGADPHWRSADGERPIMAAAYGGSRRVVSMLLECGVDVNAAAETGTTALLAALMQGYEDIAQQLEAVGAVRGYLESLVAGDTQRADELAPSLPAGRHSTWGADAMEWAIRSSRVDVVRRLLSAGADPNSGLPFGWKYLTSAVNDGEVAIVEALLDAGADPNLDRGTASYPLGEAVGSGDATLLALLLTRGADPESVDDAARTPLMQAAMWGATAAAAVLLDAGAALNHCTDRGSPLYEAVMARQYDMVGWLLAHGALPRIGLAGWPITGLPEVQEDARMFSTIREAMATRRSSEPD